MPNIVDCTVVFDPAKILQDHIAQPTQPAQPAQSAASNPRSGQSSRANTSGANNSGTDDTWIPLKYSGRSYLFLLAPAANLATTANQDAVEASNDLRVIVKVGDILRLRTTSIALQRDNQCFIKQIDVAGGELCITPPTAEHRTSTSTVIDPTVAALNQVEPVPLLDNCWEFTAVQTGLAAANMKFQVYDPKATLLGNFTCTLWYMVQP